jgi:hypothetical protein|tara:strand:+ start:5998 stop:6243 length:246 start_codon:yes stop_codon:yes gene_type:complete
MSNLQIPNLPAAIALNGNELFEAVQAGTSVKVALTQMASFIMGGGFGQTLQDYANDAGAAAGGVPLGGFYRNGSVVMVRVA